MFEIAQNQKINVWHKMKIRNLLPRALPDANYTTLGGWLWDHSMTRNGNALLLATVRILKQYQTAVGVFIVKLYDTGTSRLKLGIEHYDGLSGCEL
jgi:hypothetical protein